MKNLNLLKLELETLQKKYSRKNSSYEIPALWNLDDIEEHIDLKSEQVNPFEYFINRIELIEKSDPITKNNKVYNLFIRYSCSWDHNFSTEYKNFPKRHFRNTGTILKAIALLPYIKSIGCSKIHLLPITEIGEGGKKGELGSPYAIKNPKKIDPNLSEPILKTDIEVQFKAFVEASHHLGIEVIQEFIFRTASMDSDLALENPDWFYWIKGNVKMREEGENSGYGPPDFSQRKLEKIKEKFENNDFKDTIPPDEKFRNYFTKTPVKTARVDDQIIGLLTSLKPSKSNEVKIAPAFADWPPDDNQPPWNDVTYLKLYENAKFNYVAYNTVRAYDEELAIEDNKVNSLWEYIESILPFWIENYDIDGAMIDMGHALPSDLLKNIIQKARAAKPDFIFWEENFVPNQKSKDTGYNAVMGYLLFDSHDQSKYKNLIRREINNEFELDFFLTPENHNTKRAFPRFKNRNFPIACYLINSFLGNLNFIHSGFELLESTPVNSGLGFTDEELERIDSDKLPLFAYQKLNWNGDNIIKEMKQIDLIKSKISEISKLELKENDNLIILEINDKYKLLVNLENKQKEIKLEDNNIIFESGKIDKNNELIILEAFSTLVVSF